MAKTEDILSTFIVASSASTRKLEAHRQANIKRPAMTIRRHKARWKEGHRYLIKKTRQAYEQPGR
jgi:hypothetical protein